MILITVYKGKTKGNTYKEFTINEEPLRVFGDKKDKMTIDAEGNYVIDRWLNINEYGGYEIKLVQNKGRVENFKLYKGVNLIAINNAKTKQKITYVKDHPYARGTKAYVNAQIALNSNEIKLLLNQKTDKEEVENQIKITKEGILNEVKKKVGKMK